MNVFHNHGYVPSGNRNPHVSHFYDSILKLFCGIHVAVFFDVGWGI